MEIQQAATSPANADTRRKQQPPQEHQLIEMLLETSSDGVQQQSPSPPQGGAAWVRRAILCYTSQWTAGLHLRVLFASHLVFWSSALPALAFGSWLQRETRGGMGTVEVLVSSSLCGLAAAATGSQPLLIVGFSAPSLVFTIAVSHTAARLSIDFLPWLAWIGLWSSLLLLLLAASGGCRLVTHLTGFTWEVFRLFVGTSLLWMGIQGVLSAFSGTATLESSLLSLWLTTCTLGLSVALAGARSWQCLNSQTKELIHNYGPALAFLVFTVIPLLPKFQHIHFQHLDMPRFLYRSDEITKLGKMVSLRALPVWAILLAFIPGALLASMIFVDHNAASVLLKHACGIMLPQRSASSWDLFLVAIMACLCSLFGMPLCYGLSVQSVVHKRSLLLNTANLAQDQEVKPAEAEVVKSQRVSATLVSLLCGVPLAPGLLVLLQKIPLGVVSGLFLEMSYSCLKELKLVRRLANCLFRCNNEEPSTRESSNEASSVCATRVYSAAQVACTLVMFTSTRTQLALIFPLLLLLVIWLRHYGLVRLFSDGGALACLDSTLVESSGAPAATAGSRQTVRDKSVEAQSSAMVRHRQAHIEIESSSSSQSRGSPSLLIMASARRLKERSRRRNKRKRQQVPKLELHHDQHDQEDQHQQAQCCSDHNESDVILHTRSKRRSLDERVPSIELHSNLLFDRFSETTTVATETGHCPPHSPKRKKTVRFNTSTTNPCFVEQHHGD